MLNKQEEPQPLPVIKKEEPREVIHPSRQSLILKTEKPQTQRPQLVQVTSTQQGSFLHHILDDEPEDPVSGVGSKRNHLKTLQEELKEEGVCNKRQKLGEPNFTNIELSMSESNGIHITVTVNEES